VTIVGEVVDAVTLLLDEIEYRYPFLETKKLTIWGKRIPAYWIGPYPYLSLIEARIGVPIGHRFR
jgi:hypothetical protein